MLLDQGFIRTNNIREYRVETKFDSKKNDVYKIRAVHLNGENKAYIVKVYAEPHNAADREAELLTGLHDRGVAVPELYYRGENFLVLEFLNGPTLLDIISDLEGRPDSGPVYTGSYGLAVHLCRWLKDFYRAVPEITGSSTIFWDMNLRNFLITYRVYGLDFEDCREGCIEEDAGRLFSYIITYLPAFTSYKMRFAKQIIDILGKEMDLDSERVAWEIGKELKAIGVRRNMEIPEGIVKSALTY
ncbi:MAG: hypothetical protein HPY66_2329 [Firmicutes bacterium]|nr:hypothetical protein [Bacillota bacterium]MDI6705718.1 phosphotransferase [Bacillota bacterium]